MSNLKEIESVYNSDLKDMIDWCDEMYQSIFSTYFNRQRDMFVRMKSEERPITDDELEWILTQVPMNLFDAAEHLATVTTKQEIIKLGCKKRENEFYKNSNESTDTKKKEEAAIEVTEDKILILAYDNLIKRVEKEMSYSRELIMSAKKIYDARRNTEQSNPVSEVTGKPNDLPNYYSGSSGKQAIG